MRHTRWRCAGRPEYNWRPNDGTQRGRSCGASYNCFTWVIDAHPEDINKVDFKRANGETVMRTIAEG
jgi:hypothetical protein